MLFPLNTVKKSALMREYSIKSEYQIIPKECCNTGCVYNLEEDVLQI